LFSREKFEELMKLEGDKGARQIVRAESRLLTVAFGEAAIDIDTPQNLLS